MTVNDFTRPLPLVAVHAGMDTVLAALKIGQCDRAVVLDAQDAPVGIVRLQDVIWSAEADSVTDLAVGNFSALQPIRQVAASISLEDLYHEMVIAKPTEHWVVMAADGTCLGLVDQARWWEFWATQKQNPSDGEGMAAAIASSTPEVLPLRTLAMLLEDLPLPLMLQTSRGHILAQNTAWLHQLAALQDPEPIWQEISTFLSDPVSETGASSPTTIDSEPPDATLPFPPDDGMEVPFHPSFSVAHENGTSLHDSTMWEALLHSANQLQQSGSCQRLPQSGNCVCLCETKADGDRVWQFSGTRLGDRLPLIHPADLPASVPPERVWLVLAQDITEQHQVAKELAAKNADLVQLNRLKDEFLSCVSHELRTPLTAVLGLSNLLKDQMVGELNERQARYSHLIYQSGRHLMTIVNDMLDLTRIETGQLELTMAPLSVETICCRAFAQAKQMHKFGDSLELQDPDGTAPIPPFALDVQLGNDIIVADELRLRQMLANLLSNAMKFTDETGRIGLKVERWDGWVAFTVWDTGMGIPKNQQHLIFQKFQQLEHPLTRRFEGTGLGLVLTQRLARLHGGDVTFTSTEGQGSRFTLLLPPDPSLRGVKPRMPQPKATAWPGHSLVLVVEAVPQFLNDLYTALRQLGYRVAIARSGTEALEKARQLQPLMIFLNPLLPLLSGWDVLTLLRSHPETCDIPVLVTAGHSERGQALRHGASDFLTLPVQSEALEEAIANIQRQEAVAEQSAAKLLTILHLSPAIALRSDLTLVSAPAASAVLERSTSSPLAEALHSYPCRVLEVDDLEQANLLARVWKPDLVLLDGALPDPLSYLRQLSRCGALATLPIVTLSPENTQAAHQIPELSVFPYLGAQNANSQASDSDLSQLMQMMCQAVNPHSVASVGAGDEG
ncbi:MAG: ATP-binding protein [Cyanobacteria bacterium J06638_20]